MDNSLAWLHGHFILRAILICTVQCWILNKLIWIAVVHSDRS